MLPGGGGGIRSVSGKLAAVFSMSAPSETWSESEPDTTDATSSLSHTHSKYEGVRITSVVLTHTHTLNMKPDVSRCKTAMYAFDFGMGSGIGKCKAPWYRSKLFYLDDFGMNLPLTYSVQRNSGNTAIFTTALWNNLSAHKYGWYGTLILEVSISLQHAAYCYPISASSLPERDFPGRTEHSHAVLHNAVISL